MTSPRRNRADKELVRRGLAHNLQEAGELIAAGLVTTTAGVAVAKPATAIALDAPLEVATQTGRPYVGRGAHKLAGALAAFTPLGLEVAGKSCLDAGACTGGFTQVLLQAGAAQVIAADVGYGLLAWPLQTDPRVIVKDRCNVRLLAPAELPYRPQLIVADLSFISLRLVLPALTACAMPEPEQADLVLMVKPQFELPREKVPQGGVVRELTDRAAAVQAVADAAWALGWGTSGVVASPLPGSSGNVEYFLWLRRGGVALDPHQVDQAIAAGPQELPVPTSQERTR